MIIEEARGAASRVGSRRASALRSDATFLMSGKSAHRHVQFPRMSDIASAPAWYPRGVIIPYLREYSHKIARLDSTSTSAAHFGRDHYPCYKILRWNLKRAKYGIYRNSAFLGLPERIALFLEQGRAVSLQRRVADWARKGVLERFRICNHLMVVPITSTRPLGRRSHPAPRYTARYPSRRTRSV